LAKAKMSSIKVVYDKGQWHRLWACLGLDSWKQTLRWSFVCLSSVGGALSSNTCMGSGGSRIGQEKFKWDAIGTEALEDPWEFLCRLPKLRQGSWIWVHLTKGPDLGPSRFLGQGNRGRE
jgi:hypothetical protein